MCWCGLPSCGPADLVAGYQTLLAGIGAIGAAWLTIRAMRATTNSQIGVLRDEARERRQAEAARREAELSAVIDRLLSGCHRVAVAASELTSWADTALAHFAPSPLADALDARVAALQRIIDWSVMTLASHARPDVMHIRNLISDIELDLARPIRILAIARNGGENLPTYRKTCADCRDAFVALIGRLEHLLQHGDDPVLTALLSPSE